MSSDIVILIIGAWLTLAAAQGNRGGGRSDRCAEGWSPLDSKSANPFRCGKYFSDRMTYDEANSFCANPANSPGRNGQLVVIPDKGTNRRVAEIILEAINGPFPAWIGLKLNEPKNEDEERVWKWHNTGRLRGFENWAPNSPNNAKERGGQECVYFNDYRMKGTWNDFECATLMQFVCQYEA